MQEDTEKDEQPKTGIQDRDLVDELQVENEKLKRQVTDLQKDLEGYVTKPEYPPKADGKIRWRKTGGGTFRMAGGKIIKPNQVFEATPEEIPEAFRDVIVSLEELPQEAPLVPVAKYEIRAKIGGWFDVVEPVSGKPMNEKGLRREEAEKLLAELS